MFRRDDMLVRDTAFTVVEQVRNFGDDASCRMPGSRLLSPDELQMVFDVVKAEARAPKVLPVAEGKGQRIDSTLEVDTHRLAPGRTESAIGLWSMGGGYSRIIFGEWQHGAFRLLWDGPLVGTEFAGRAYQDLDGDGVEEIIIRGAMSAHFATWVAFDYRGKELTRQDFCVQADGWVSDEEATCAILATDLDFLSPSLKRADGKRDLLAWNIYYDEPARRYTLRDGRYVLETAKATRRPPAKKPKQK